MFKCGSDLHYYSNLTEGREGYRDGVWSFRNVCALRISVWASCEKGNPKLFVYNMYIYINQSHYSP
jgi:hypothetical protein